MIIVLFLITWFAAVHAMKCPTKCTCSSSSISCTGLKAFPTLKSKSVSSLRIIQSKFDIPAYAFKDMPHLRTLTVEYSNISQIYPCSFKNMTLTQIYFTRNNIDIISTGAFRNRATTSSAYIYFRYGKIGVISSNAFYQLKNIYQMKFENLNITTVEKHAFNDFTNGYYLYIRYSNITTLDSNAIDVKIRYFYFERNSVMNIGCLALGSTRSCSELTVRCDCDLLPILKQRSLGKVHCFRQSQLHDVIHGYGGTCSPAPASQPANC